MSDNNQKSAYWKENLRIIVSLMTVWFVVSFGCGILLVDILNTLSIGGYGLGFWFAQQGSIYVFVVLIFVYARKIDKLDQKYNVQED